jgi:chromate transporter
MKTSSSVLWAIVSQFSALSLMAFGGANAVVPEIHRVAVDARHWMPDADFTALFAISQAAPGPNVMIATLVGWRAAGLPGALLATVAMCLPSCVLAYWVAGLWYRFRDAAWRPVVAAGLAPVTVGLLAATFWLLARSADQNLRLAMITAGTAAIACFTKLNPLWAFGAAAAAGFFDVV